MGELLFSGHPTPDVRIRGFQTAPPDRQSVLSLLAERAKLDIAFVDGYLAKPCTARETLEEVERILRERSIPLPTKEDRIRMRVRQYDPEMCIRSRGTDHSA